MRHESKAEEMREEDKEKEEKRRRGGHIKEPHHPAHHPRKRGGHVPGKMAKHRPDRRARGGATSDEHPMSSAERMSAPSFEGGRVGQNDEGGKGHDRD